MKKILLFIGMFLFIFNVKALTFNVNITEINDLGNNGTLGSITNIDLENKEVDAYFQDIGDEVRFGIVITNSGDRAGTLRSITITSSSDKMEYTTSLPENGLAINGNDTNGVAVIAKVLPGATNGTSSTELKITYNYDEGSCPEGEILSDDESMCLCPEGMERNETGICVTPEKPVECKDDEIYNETKKICEKKVVPVNPSNPKTMDNIILITLLFVVSGLGIYAVMFKKLKTNKKKITAGVITGVTTLALSFTVLASVFGLDNLLSAIVNPITKSKELVVTVNETLDLIETWDGDCDVTGTLTPDNVFDGGTGTESDPYQIRTANQLACFAKSVNEGNTYEGKFIKQTKNIKLNDNLNEQAEAGDLSNAHIWISAGYHNDDDKKSFNGTYDGDNKIISGLYITSVSAPDGYTYKGLFGYAKNATLKNIILSDVFMSDRSPAGALLGLGYESLVVDNVTTYGNGIYTGYDNAAVIATFDGNNVGGITVTNTTNNINIVCDHSCSGIIDTISNVPSSETANVVFRNVTNNGDITINDSLYAVGGVIGQSTRGKAVIDNVSNTGVFTHTYTAVQYSGGTALGGLIGVFGNGTITNSYNTGDFNDVEKVQNFGGLVGQTQNGPVTINNCYNSGDMSQNYNHEEGLTEAEDDAIRSKGTYIGGILGYNGATITNSYNTGDITGASIYVGGISGSSGTIENCYNLGDISAAAYVGGILATTGSGDVRNSYNKGNIIVFGGTPRTGGILGGFGGNVYNSYNEGNILFTSKYDGMLSGGVCAECGVVENSYNRGNITAKYNANGLGGIVWRGTAKNCYNSGTITFEDADPSLGVSDSDFLNIKIGGIFNYPGSSYDIYNNYNLGNIVVNKSAYVYPLWQNPQINLNGISADWSSTIYNSVNAGDITLIVKGRLNSRSTIYLNGIGPNEVNSSFNAGTITLDDSALDVPIINDMSDGDDDYDPEKHSVFLGEISFWYNAGTGNKFNTSSSNYASGQYYPIAMGVKDEDEYNTAELARTSGTYTSESTPSILSIINGDNAYNDTLDEDGLPTLRVFNE